MPNRTEARRAKAALKNATGRLPLLRLFSTPLTTGKNPFLYHGKVVPNQNRTVAIETGTMANISRGRPTSPTAIPIIGIQTPKVVRWRTAGVWLLGHSRACAKISATVQTTKLMRGAAKPSTLACDRQSERVGILRY